MWCRLPHAKRIQLGHSTKDLGSPPTPTASLIIASISEYIHQQQIVMASFIFLALCSDDA
jgi:hypothetical protein